MNIIAIKQSKSGNNDYFISDEFSEYTLEEILQIGLVVPFQNISIVSRKSGKNHVRLKPNHLHADNLETKAISCNDGDFLFFDRHFIYLKAKNGHIKKKWKAFSGNPESTTKDQQKADFGPLPEGEYVVNFSKTLDVKNNQGLWDVVKWINKSPAWGFVATPIVQAKGTSFNRGDFYIHGGLFDGTKGCIEINGFDNGDFHTFMRLYKRNFKLIVNY
jgi:hypothetical protein